MLGFVDRCTAPACLRLQDLSTCTSLRILLLFALVSELLLQDYCYYGVFPVRRRLAAVQSSACNVGT